MIAYRPREEVDAIYEAAEQARVATVRRLRAQRDQLERDIVAAARDGMPVPVCRLLMRVVAWIDRRVERSARRRSTL